MTVYKNADEHGLPRHHFMKMFLAASPLTAATSSVSRELLPIYTDWLKHKLNPSEHPTRELELSADVLKDIGMGALHGWPATALSGLVGGYLLDSYLHHKLKN